MWTRPTSRHRSALPTSGLVNLTVAMWKRFSDLTLRYVLRQRLALGRPVTYVDATNLTPQERAPYIGIGKSYGCDVEAVFFAVPIEVCRERNAHRQRVVPDDAMEKMALKLVPPEPGEGFCRISIVTVADLHNRSTTPPSPDIYR